MEQSRRTCTEDAGLNSKFGCLSFGWSFAFVPTVGDHEPEPSMTTQYPTRRNPSEDGYILLGVIVLLAIFVIAMAVAAPKIAASIQRDRDLETMERGKQYIRAIQLYYRKFNAYPPNIDALVKTNEIRFLRRRYIDPTTGKDDWKPILFGQNKTPMAMGFFGQPLGLGGNVGAGTGPGNTLGGTGLGGGGLMGQSGTPTGTLGTTGTPGATGSTGTTGTTGSTDTSSSSTSGTSGTSPTLGGGGGIIGVSPASPKKSIYVYKKKDHYNQWEFLYSPLSDMQQMGGGNIGAGGGTGLTPGGGIGGGTGTGLPGGGGTGGPGVPNSPSPSPTPTPPTQ